MGTKVNVQGVTTGRPGVYANPSFAKLGGQQITVHRMCVIGEFPWLQKATPAEYATLSAMRKVYPSSDELQLVAHLLGNAANDDRVKAPGTVYLVNAKPTAQAQLVLVDADGVSAITIKSKLWGAAGNKVLFKLIAGTTNPPQLTAQASRDGVTEDFIDVESGNIASFTYGETEATTMQLALDPIGKTLTITYTKTLIAAGVYTPTKMAFDGAIQFTPSALVTGSAVIVGTNKATGLADTETVSWAASVASKTSTKTWSAITTITFTVDAGQTFAISGFAFYIDLASAQYTKLSAAVDRINAFAAQGFVAEVLSPKWANIPAIQLDIKSATTIKGVTLNLIGETAAFIAALNQSGIVTATQHANWAGKPPAVLGSQTFLAGGNEGSAVETYDDTDWTAALDSMKFKDAQVFVLLAKEASRHKLLRAHIQWRAGVGSSEACGFVGGTELEALSALDVRSAALNTRHLALAFEQAEIDDYAGTTRIIDPPYVALAYAAMHSGMPVAQSLIHRRPNFNRTIVNTAIDVDDDADTLLDRGLLFSAHDNLGLRIEDGLTTYRTNPGDPVQTEISANESFNTSIRDLRTHLKTILGDGTTARTSTWIKSQAKTRLERQVDEGMIRAFIAASLDVVEDGDTFVVEYEVGPSLPVKFILLNPSAVKVAA